MLKLKIILILTFCFGIFGLFSWILGNLFMGDVYKNTYYKVDNNRCLKYIENSINNMNGRQFENFIGFLFSLNGNKVMLTPATRDGGKDLIIDNNLYIECKCWSECNTIGTPIVQKLIGACIADGISKALIVTTSNCTQDAIKIVQSARKTLDIEVWNKYFILDFCKQVGLRDVMTYLGYSKSEIEALEMAK
jgi:HJR/Mrr/RecB family endonuclease